MRTFIPAPGAFREPPQGPGTNTSKSLLDIQGKLPVPDNTNGATAGDVLAGKTFWGLTNGQWGNKTGTRKRPWGCDPADSDIYFNCLDDCISDIGQDVEQDCVPVCQELAQLIIIKGILAEYCAR